jgi:hypothetical protein
LARSGLFDPGNSVDFEAGLAAQGGSEAAGKFR